MTKKIIISLWLSILFSGTLFAQSKRIVSLAPSLTEQLYLLQAQKNIVGCTSYCTKAKNDGVPVVASAIDVNVERVVSMKPDLVITSSLTKPGIIKTFEQLGIKVMVYPYPKSFSDLNNQFLELAASVERKAIGEQIIQQQKERLNKALNNYKPQEKLKVFMEIGAKPLFSVVPNTFMNDYILTVGGENIANHLKVGSITREAVLMRNPDIIFIVTMGIVGQEEQEKWKSYKQMNASKNNKIFVIDSSIASTPTPQNFVETVVRMITLLTEQQNKN